MIPARDYERHVNSDGVAWTKTWRDALGRPMASGAVRLTPADVQSVVAAPVTIRLVNGTAMATLAPGRYQLEGTIRTLDEHDVSLPAEEIVVQP